MKKKLIALSALAAFSLNLQADTNSDLKLQLELLKKQISALEAKLNKNTKKIKKVAKKVKKTAKKLNKVKAHDAGDNIKWDIDFRTAVDNIDYKHAKGNHSKNSSLLSNRLLLGMKYKADDKITFYGTLAYQKTYGENLADSQAPYANFDWVTNENALNDNTLKVKEAYWLYMNDTFFGANIPWTASIGRRPSTGGLGANYREGDKRKSAIASTVNLEFDGASFKWTIDQVTPLTGAWVKLCMGRGLTNAKPRFDMTGTDYANDANLENSDMIGMIFVPYDDGQYSVHTNYAVANHLIGFDSNGTAWKGKNGYGDISKATFQDEGSISIMTAMVKAEGVGSEISDFLDDTIVFASYSMSKTDPKSGQAMLGSTKSETGHSFWIGANMPCLLTEDGRWGVEYNHGSKYWRSMTYGEDTMIGSKIAARGDAWDLYYNKPLTPSLTFNLRYTYIDYDYTGSNSFFGADGTPVTMERAIQDLNNDGKPDYGNPVTEASDIRAYIRYRF
jgi:hypothetical protein